jgi:DNA-binding transcriptional LysR family regulator
MPAELVRSDLSRGSLVKIVPEDAPKGFVISMHAVYRADAPPGIAGRWFIDQLRAGSDAGAASKTDRRKPRRRR